VPRLAVVQRNLGPVYEFHALMEQTHRYIVVQIGLGAVTAFAGNRAPTVADHLTT
jgi:hypothetical protein